MKELNYFSQLGYITEKLANGGVFLSVPGNTMTIGWAFPGYTWRLPAFVALVRPQRHTHALLRAAGEFTISVPTKDALRAQLAFAGSASGRDTDKFQGHGITAREALCVRAPIIAECGLHLECKVLLEAPMPSEGMDAEVLRSCYPARDMHDMFFGQVVKCYTTDEE